MAGKISPMADTIDPVLYVVQGSGDPHAINNACLAVVLTKAETMNNLTIYHLTNYQLVLSLSKYYQLSLCFFVPQCLCGYESFMQNKPNFPKNRAIASSSKSKGYKNEHRFLA